MLEFRYDTQLLIDGDDLDEDEIFATAFWLSAETGIRSRSTSTPMSPGSFWNTELLSVRSMTSSWRTWTDRAEA